MHILFNILSDNKTHYLQISWHNPGFGETQVICIDQSVDFYATTIKLYYTKQ